MSNSMEKLLQRMILPNADLRCTAEAAMTDPYWSTPDPESKATKAVHSGSSYLMKDTISCVLNLFIVHKGILGSSPTVSIHAESLTAFHTASPRTRMASRVPLQLCHLEAIKRTTPLRAITKRNSRETGVSLICLLA